MWVAAAANDFYDLGEPPGGDDPADQVHSFHDVMEIIRTTNIDGLVEFYDALIASSTTTDLEEHYTSRAARYNEFDCCIDLIPEPSPLSVTITGPTELGWKQTGTLTANATGGTGAYTYKWYDRPGGTGSWNYTGTTTKTISVTMVWTQGIEYKAEATSGGVTVSDTHFISYCASGLCLGPVAGKRASGEVLHYVLEPAYPNPFNPQTQIRFAVPEAAHVRLTVYDVTGREVARLVDQQIEAGYQSVTWSAGDLPSGVYFYRLVVGSFTATKAITLLR